MNSVLTRREKRQPTEINIRCTSRAVDSAAIAASRGWTTRPKPKILPFDSAQGRLWVSRAGEYAREPSHPQDDSFCNAIPLLRTLRRGATRQYRQQRHS